MAEDPNILRGRSRGRYETDLSWSCSAGVVVAPCNLIFKHAVGLVQTLHLFFTTAKIGMMPRCLTLILTINLAARCISFHAEDAVVIFAGIGLAHLDSFDFRYAMFVCQ